MVSVCIPTYNGGKFIKQQLETILCQLNSGDEVIISDDGSTDDTLMIISAFNDPRIKIVHHTPKKRNYNFDLTTRNFENALNYAQGTFIFLADQDDEWVMDKVKKTVALLENYDLVLHDCEVIDEHGKVLQRSYFEQIKSEKGIIKNLYKNSYLGCCMAFRRSIIQNIVPFPKREIPHDIWIGLICEYYGNVKFLSEKLVLYRRHGNNLSASSEKSKNSIIFKLKYRAVILRELLMKIILHK